MGGLVTIEIFPQAFLSPVVACKNERKHGKKAAGQMKNEIATDDTGSNFLKPVKLACWYLLPKIAEWHFYPQK